MKRFRRALTIAASLLAAVLLLSSAALAAGQGSGGGGGNGSGGGSGGAGGGGGSGTSGSVYSDLIIALRAPNGTPILKKYVVPATAETGTTTEYCPQPVSYQAVPGIQASANPVDGRTVWVIPLEGQWIGDPAAPLPAETITACAPQPQYAMFVSEVNLERLNLVRTSDTVLAQKLDDVTAKLASGSSITLDPTGRINIDGTPIDAAPENAAIYQALMTTGTIPGLPPSMAGPPAVIGPAPASPGSNSQFDAMELAAMTIGATAAKTTPLSVDAVEYYNQIIGFPPASGSTGDAYVSPWGLKFVTSLNPDSAEPMTGTQQYVNYTTVGGQPFSYNRSETFKGSVTWLTVPTLTWKVSKILTVVPFDDLSPTASTGTLHGLTAFAQLADDVRALCNFVPDNTYIPGFFMDVPGVDTGPTQENAIHDPAVDLGALPPSAIETTSFPVTSQLLNPFAGNPIPTARLRVTVHAPTALSAQDVSVTAVATGQSVPFSVDGNDLTGWWGPATGFPVSPGYNVSTSFDVTVATGAPTGAYDITLDLLTVNDPAQQVLARDTGTITVLPNQPTVLWGGTLPTLVTQGTWMTLPLRVYSPAGGTGQLHLTITGPGSDPTTAITAADVSIYASNGVDMVGMPLTLDDQGQLVGTWNLTTLPAGFTPVTWYATISTGAPVGNYAFGVGLEGANTLDPLVVTVAAPESHGEQPPTAGEKTITSAASTTFTVSEASTFTVTTSGSPTPRLTAVGTLPAGVTFTDNGNGTATLAGTPAQGSTGSYELTVYAEFGDTIAAQTFQLTVAAPPPAPTPTPAPAPASAGYWLAASDGGVFAFGDASFYGSMGGKPLDAPVVGMATTPSQQGYWLVASDGGVFAFGDASFYGSMGGKQLNRPIVGITATPSGAGYWLVASDGGVFAFGTVPFLGSLPGESVQVSNVIAIAATPGGTGYWLVSATGTVYQFGKARHLVTERGTPSPVSAIAGTPTGGGYWITTQNGAVYAAGTARDFGTLPGLGVTPSLPVIGIMRTTGTTGYWLIASDGGIFAFGTAPFVGSLPLLGVHVTNIVGAVPVGD